MAPNQARRFILYLWLAIVLLLTVTGCARFVGDSNFTLYSGETISGDLIAPSANVLLEPRSRVTGSIIMLCCNLTVDGEVDGDILALTGNIRTGPEAVIRGNVNVMSGNVLRSPGSSSK